MKTKIKSVTLVNQQGTQFYEVGREYNGLKIDLIEDESDCPNEGNITIIYRGYTANKDYVFEAINVPIDVLYEKITFKNP